MSVTNDAPVSAIDTAGRLDLVREKLSANPDGIIESIARECGVPSLQVLMELSHGVCTFASAGKFLEIWNDIVSWGDVLMIVQTPAIVFECKSSLPSGSYGRGYFNFHGDFAASGHLKADAVTNICFVDRKFHGRRSCSIQFYGADGEAVFKIFVRRGPDRDMEPKQLEAFEELSSRYKS